MNDTHAEVESVPFVEHLALDLYGKIVRELAGHIDEENMELIGETSRKLTQSWPEDSLGWKMLGIFSGITDDIDQAKLAFRNYVSLMISQGKIKEAQTALINFYHSRQETEDLQLKTIIRQELGQLFTAMKWNDGVESQLHEQGILWARLEHDAKQLSYLLEKGFNKPNLKGAQKELMKLYNLSHSLVDHDNPIQWVKTNLADNKYVSANFNQILHYHNCAPFPDGALNTELDWHKIEDDFITKDVPLVCIDGFLSDDALMQMQEFCLSSTIWKRQYPDAYFAATIDGGFVSDLHLKITHELNNFLPLILGPLQLVNSVAFKIHPSCGAGQGLHADSACVGINLWTTPDDANLDSESGGVLIYDVLKPDDWVSTNSSEIAQTYLEGVNYNTTRIPYQCNRAVLFNPSLFHKPEKIKFKTDYENWRTNITFFYDKPILSPQP
jgi:hypothetical protein